YYSTFKGLAKELNVFRSLTNDIDKLKAQQNEFLVSKFLAGLNLDLQKLKGHILAGETVPSITDIFSRLQHVAYPMQHESSPKDNSAFTVGRGRGCSRGLGGGRGTNIGRGSSFGGKPPMKCSYCGKNGHTIDYCWDKHGKPDWVPKTANHAMLDGDHDSVSSGDTP
ncbi:hypothetical protein CFOL_v3_17304, partial [Cephalotus follicularis]